MSNSKLISFTKISPNKNSPRNHKIDTITIHCVVGQCSIEALGNVFSNSSIEASSNYGIGYDGKIGMFVEEKDRSWCSSSSSNDNRAITIEVASDTSYPYAVTAKAYAALLNLVTDICKRNGIKKLVWSKYKSDRVNHRKGCNMTVHRDYANKSCPGEYLYKKHPEIAAEVNKRLNKKPVYRVRKSWKDTKSQIGTYTDLKKAKKAANQHKGYFVFDESGKAIYPIVKPKSYTVRVTVDALNIRKGAGTLYKKVGMITDRGVYTIIDTKGNWGKLKSGAGWICLKYTKKV